MASASVLLEPLQAQLLPFGPENQVNAYTTGSQSAPEIQMAPDGSFLVFWCCGVAEAEDRRALVARRFSPDGTPLGAEFAVDDYDLDYPSDVAAEGDGDLVVVWGQGHEGCPGCSEDYVKARRFAANGTPLGRQFAVSDPPGTTDTRHGRVAAHHSGGFVVTWSEGLLYARRYDAGGDPAGGAFQVAGSSGASSSPSIATQPKERFVVVWTDRTGYDLWELRGRRYDGDGVPMGGVLQISDSTATPAFDADVAARVTGEFVVVWERGSPGSEARDIAMRRFDPEGVPTGPAKTVPSLATGFRWEPTVVHEGDGSFVVVWSSDASTGGDTDRGSVQARRFTSDGLPLGQELQLNSYTTENQTHPRIAVTPGGDLVAVWQSLGSAGTDGSFSSVQMRRFRTPFFSDGFETATTGRWSLTFP